MSLKKVTDKFPVQVEPDPATPMPGWRVDLERRKAHAKGLEQTSSAQTGGMRALQIEHAKFKAALELIADGADASVARQTLGRHRPYHELVDENKELLQLVELMEGTLKAIRLGHLKASDLPDDDEMSNVGSRHTDGSPHPPEDG